MGAVSRSKEHEELLPATLVGKLSRPIIRFMEIEAAGGLVLLACTIFALGIANSSYREWFASIWSMPIGFEFGEFRLVKPLLLWINDGLMTVFFFVVGLEIKRELVAGELRDLRVAALPVFAAIGGMLAPALVYLACIGGKDYVSGWAIPTATDIAFVVGFLALLGSRVPLGLKIMVLTLAIVDDIGAVLVIALFYTTKVHLLSLFLAFAGLVLTVVLNLAGVRRISVYVIVGATMWYFLLKSGVHPTIAGVLLGLLTPAHAWIADQRILDMVSRVAKRWDKNHAELANGSERDHSLSVLATMAREAISPLTRLELALHPWVAYAIVPLFALANASLTIKSEAIYHPITIAVAVGLVVGKPVGIFVFSWLAVRLGLARLPTNVNWLALLGAGCLAGIGFTMSIFIASLALVEERLEAGKLGTLMGSAVSAVIGMTLLLISLKGNDQTPERVIAES